MKEAPHIEKFAADTILQRGVTLNARAPFLMRFFGKKTIGFKITSIFEGTTHRVASYYLSTGLTTEKIDDCTVEEALMIMYKHGKSLNKAVAVAILNGYFAGYFFVKPLAWYLRWHCIPKEIFAIVTVLIIYGGTADFMNTTKSVRKMILTAPTTGQKNEGS